MAKAKRQQEELSAAGDDASDSTQEPAQSPRLSKVQLTRASPESPAPKRPKMTKKSEETEDLLQEPEAAPSQGMSSVTMSTLHVGWTNLPPLVVCLDSAN